MIRFQQCLSDGLKKTLKIQIVTMSTTKKKSQHTDDPVAMNYNTDLEFSNIFNYELAPVPKSMFQDSGETRYPKTKLVSKNKLKVEVTVGEIQTKGVFNDAEGMLYSGCTGLKLV